MSARSDLKNRLAWGKTIVAPGAYDPVSARLVQSLGFDTIYTGGYMTGAHLAVTEPLMTMTEQVEVLISLPEYQEVESQTTEPEFQGPA